MVIHCKNTFVCVFVFDVHVCVISGLSKWVRQLVQHHGSFNDAMQSLVAFSQVQQKVWACPADSQALSSTISSPNRKQGLPNASDPQTPHSCVKPPESQQDSSPSAIHFFSSTQLKAEQRGKAGELNWKLKGVFWCCKANISAKYNSRPPKM